MGKILRAIKKIIPEPIFDFFSPVYHWILSLLAAVIYWFPSRRGRMKVIGVTGTSGKTTTAEFLKFYAAILTNLSEEHLEAHGGFENYRRAKGEIFRIAPIVFLNGEDPNLEYFQKISPKEKIIYIASDYPPDLKLNLSGEFNKMNAVAALAFAKREGVLPSVAKEALAKIPGIPGRMEYVNPPARVKKDFRVLVDYAFLPQTLKSFFTR